MREPAIEVKIHAGFTKDGTTERVILYHGMPKALLDMPEAQVGALLEKELGNVALEKAYELYGALVAYSYEDRTGFSRYVYGDTLIQASLPYCLHLPNGSALEVHVPERGFSALVTLHKIWTVKGAGSSEADFFHDSRSTFFTNNSLKAPSYPINPALGWEQDYSGVNIEKLKDNNGVFRYTAVLIEVRTGITAQQLEQATGDATAVVHELTSKALDVVNRVLDAYRYVTRANHVERVGRLNVHNIYFTKENVGFYLMSALDSGVGGAMMNHPRIVGSQIKNMLALGERPPFPELLQLDAEASLDRRAYTLAVVKSFQALEIFVENFILDRYQALGLTEQEALRVLEVRWRTKERLKDLMTDTSGHSAAETPGWQEWSRHYENVRNEVIHRGKEPSEDEAKRVVQLNTDLMTWVKGLSPANTGLPLARKLLRGRSIWKTMGSAFRRLWRRLCADSALTLHRVASNWPRVRSRGKWPRGSPLRYVLRLWKTSLMRASARRICARTFLLPARRRAA